MNDHRGVKVLGRAVLAVIVMVGIAACSGDAEDEANHDFVADVEAALEAVEAEFAGPQEYFEVTATPQLTNVFVAVDDATAAVPYVFIDGELEAPGPRADGASGFTFAADAVDFDPEVILSMVADEVPDATIESLSVYGGPSGSVNYVVAVRSPAGGALDVTVAADGSVLSVDPV